MKFLKKNSDFIFGSFSPDYTYNNIFSEIWKPFGWSAKVLKEKVGPYKNCVLTGTVSTDFV